MSIDLVTGGAGFIGAHLVHRLVDMGRRVRVVDDLSTGTVDRLTGVRSRIEFVDADVSGDELAPLMEQVDRVFHLAAIPSVPRSVGDPLPSHRSIATGTIRLLIAARDAGVSRFVLSSSSSVYGESPVSPKHEELPIRPLSPYAVAKAAAEGYARVWAHLYGLHTVSLRYFNVFGPGQDPTSAYAAVVPLFITRALARRTLQINGDGRQTRDFTYVENVIEANLAAASAVCAAGSVYNVAAGQPHSVLDLVAALREIIGRDIDVEHRADRPGDIRHSHAEIRAAKTDLNWHPRVSFTEGLRRTVEWYRRQ